MVPGRNQSFFMSLIIKIKACFLKLLSRHEIKPFSITDSPKVLILMHQNIGDMIVCSPILRDIRNAYPTCNLHVIASQANKEIATKVLARTNIVSTLVGKLKV